MLQNGERERELNEGEERGRETDGQIARLLFALFPCLLANMEVTSANIDKHATTCVNASVSGNEKEKESEKVYLYLVESDVRITPTRSSFEWALI